jgi:hypothetical protein
VTDLIELVGAVDGLVQMQARADGEYFFKICGRTDELTLFDRPRQFVAAVVDIGASALPIRSAWLPVIMPARILLNRGSWTPEMMYCHL